MTRAVVYLYTLLGLMQHLFEARKERGATAVEYGLLVGLIAVVIIVAVTALGGKLTGLFNSIVAAMADSFICSTRVFCSSMTPADSRETPL